MDHQDNGEDDRVVLLLDLDCFYAQCERIRLGFDNFETCCIALLQWRSCLAVSYPARVYGIKRGDGWEEVHKKSQGKCMAVHVPINSGNIINTDSGDVIDFKGDYDAVYRMSPEEQLKARKRDIGRIRYSTEGKACLEPYRIASRRIFEVVMECLGMIGTKSSNNNDKTKTSNISTTKGVVLEKASIDEFYLDVTGLCKDPDHPLWHSIQQQIKNFNMKESKEDSRQVCQELTLQNHNTLLVGQETNPTLSLESDPVLDRGCQLAYFIRQSVFHQLGFTVSAGISINKTIAKLAAGFGKPNGQAVVLADQIPPLMKETKLTKVRNFGGKLGKAVLALLPPDVPPTMGSVARYLSLPQLQDHFKGDLNTAKYVFDACRGRDAEPVESKNSQNVVKSITAFKNLPRDLDSDVEEAGFKKWLLLLVQEVVSRVETDAQRNHRYPRNCTVHYGLEGRFNAAGKLDMRSFRIPFPAQRLQVSDRIAKIMEQIPHKIIEREAGKRVGPDRKTRFRIKPSRIGVCATEMSEDVNKTGSIANYFATAVSSSSSTGGGAIANTRPSKSKVNKTESSQQIMEHLPQDSDDIEGSNSKEKKISDVDLRMAQQLQAAYDREHQTVGAFEEKRAVKESTSSENSKAPSDSEKSQLTSSNDPDHELAARLQASYDRENMILGTWEANKKRGLLSTSKGSGQRSTTTKRAKTKKISSFFSASK